MLKTALKVAVNKYMFKCMCSELRHSVLGFQACHRINNELETFVNHCYEKLDVSETKGEMLAWKDCHKEEFRVAQWLPFKTYESELSFIKGEVTDRVGVTCYLSSDDAIYLPGCLKK